MALVRLFDVLAIFLLPCGSLQIFCCVCVCLSLSVCVVCGDREERNLTEWAKERLTELLGSYVFTSVDAHVTKVDKIEGDVCVSPLVFHCDDVITSTPQTPFFLWSPPPTHASLKALLPHACGHGVPVTCVHACVCSKHTHVCVCVCTIL